MLILNLFKDINQFHFKFSNRMEYRDYKVVESHFRHKQSFTVIFPAVTFMHLRFYTAEESFFKLNGERTHLARFYGGISTIEQNRFHLKLYYALEKYKLAAWNTRDIVGINMSFSL